MNADDEREWAKASPFLPRTGRDVLLTELYYEFARLRTRDFWQSLLPEKKLTPRERERFDALGAWLLRNPPRGFAYRCAVCYMGTNCYYTRECLACAIC